VATGVAGVIGVVAVVAAEELNQVLTLGIPSRPKSAAANATTALIPVAILVNRFHHRLLTTGCPPPGGGSSAEPPDIRRP
jgi:hypothetical protein